MNIINITMVDVLSELIGKIVVMSGDDYVIFENLEKVSQNKVDEALLLKEQKEKEILNQNKINEADKYLKNTDWIETYKLRHELGLEIIPEDSSKLEVIAKREEYKLFLKNLEGVN